MKEFTSNFKCLKWYTLKKNWIVLDSPTYKKSQISTPLIIGLSTSLNDFPYLLKYPCLDAVHKVRDRSKIIYNDGTEFRTLKKMK